MTKKLLHSETVPLGDGLPHASVEIHSLKEEGEAKQVLHIIATVEGHVHEHRLTVGSQDAPIPEAYDLAQLERDIEAAKQTAIQMAHGHHRSAKLMEQWAAKKKAEAAQ